MPGSFGKDNRAEMVQKPKGLVSHRPGFPSWKNYRTPEVGLMAPPGLLGRAPRGSGLVEGLPTLTLLHLSIAQLWEKGWISGSAKNFSRSTNRLR